MSNAAAYDRQHAIYQIVLNEISKSYGPFPEVTFLEMNARRVTRAENVVA